MLQIDPSKVLLIVNSDNAQSIADADDYVVKRGLNAAHRLGFAFGTSNAILLPSQLKTSGGPACTTAPYTGQMFAPAIAAYQNANEIQAVIMSTYTPCRVDPQVVAQPGAVFTLAAYAGAARFFNTFGAGSSPSYFSGDPVRTTIEEIISTAPQDWIAVQSSSLGRVPHGRLGCPDYTSGTIAEIALRGSLGGGSIYTRAVTKALVSEATSKTSVQHALTQVLDYSIISPADNTTAFNWAKRIAMPNVANMGVDYVLSNAGTPPITLPGPLFALCLAEEFNSPLTIRDAFTCVDGAWGFMWTSSAGIFGDALLYNGGSAAIMTFGEPYNYGMPAPNEVFIYATRYQTSVMLAGFLGYGNGCGFTVCGDPLYRPYLSTPTTNPVLGVQPYGHL